MSNKEKKGLHFQKFLYDLSAKMSSDRKIQELTEQLRRFNSFRLPPETAKEQTGGATAPKNLTDTEQNILEALGKDTLKGESLLKKAGYDYTGTYRGILSNLKKRDILGHNDNGYFRIKS
jgi:hypothetical protein